MLPKSKPQTVNPTIPFPELMQSLATEAQASIRMWEKIQHTSVTSE